MYVHYTCQYRYIEENKYQQNDVYQKGKDIRITKSIGKKSNREMDKKEKRKKVEMLNLNVVFSDPIA